MKLTPHEEKVLELIQKYPEIVDDPARREQVAQENGLTEKTLRNRIGDLKKYGVIGTKLDPSVNVGATNDEIDLSILISTVWKWKKLIITFTGIISILAAMISLLMPKSFIASSVIMPPTSNSELSMLNALSNTTYGGLLGQTIDETNIFMAILNSRTIKEGIIDEYNLIEIYDVDNIEEALITLSEYSSIEIEEMGTIRISVTAKTNWFPNKDEANEARLLSANITDSYVELLDITNKRLKTEHAALQRGFIEKRYYQNLDDLENSEELFKKFQEKNNIVSIVDQTTEAIQTTSDIQRRISSNNVRLHVLKNMVNADNPEIDQLQNENNELLKQLMQLYTGSSIESTGTEHLIPAFTKIPELGIEFIRLQRNVEIQNQLFIFLTKQYEEAKINEAKDTPTLQILDPAVIPIKRSAPKRTIIVLISFALAVFMSIALVVVIDNYKITPYSYK